LEDREPRRDARDGRDDLHGAGAGADDAVPLALEVDAVVPAGGVEHRSGEAFEAGQRRVGGPVELADGADEHVGDDLLDGGVGVGGRAHPDPPDALVVVPAGGDELGAEPDVREHAVGAGDVLEVAEDLGLLREVARPVGFLRPGEGVERAGGVDAGAGIAVLQPDAADGVVAFDDGVVQAELAELDRGADTALPRADDDDAQVVGLGEPGPVAGEVGEHQQQGRDVGRLECLAEAVVVGGHPDLVGVHRALRLRRPGRNEFCVTIGL